jgi:hypothetical protein
MTMALRRKRTLENSQLELTGLMSVFFSHPRSGSW